MKVMPRFRLLAVVVVGVLLIPLPALAGRPLDAVETFEYSQNMHPLGFSERAVPVEAPRIFNSDLAFWGNTAYQGHYAGFRIIDISASANPREIINYEECSPGTTFGNQGDVIIWDTILVRSWNSPAREGSTCDGEPVPVGTRGVHVFDVSDPTNPELVAYVITAGGSHTATGVPDLENNRLLVYSSRSPGGFDIIEVPLDDPAGANHLRFVFAERSCHDIGVILGDVMRASCSGGGGFSMFSLGGESGGSLDDPHMLYSKPLPGLGGHSAAFTWDGKVYVHGWEPGGGSRPRCTATGTEVAPGVFQTDDMKSYFFFDTESGEEIGKFVLPRDQTLEENCTIHNYNVVPSDKRYVLVSGNYQAGISVVDFTDPANAREIAFADPAPLVPTQLGGDWSTYWYNGFIYQSDITRGLIIWKLSDPAVAGAKKFGHLNPQTQETSFEVNVRPNTGRNR